MADSLQWYDSLWLDTYIAAKRIIADVAPRRLSEFIAAFAPLRTDPAFEVRWLPQVVDTAMIEQIRETIRAIPQAQLEMHEIRDFGRFVVHDLPQFTELQHDLVDRVSECARQAVEPRYNFLSMYTRRGICDPHLDAPFAKWTLDICIDQSDPWPIHISKVVPWPEDRLEFRDGSPAAIMARTDLEFRSFALAPGDAVLFAGSSQWHYRDALTSQKGNHFCDLLFMHYIPEGTAELVLPINWPQLFDLPELAQLPGLDRVA